MKYILPIALGILFLACNPSQEKKEDTGEIPAETITQKEEVLAEASIKEASIPQPQKIDLDSALLDELNEYLLDLDEGVLGICCYDLLDIRLNYDFFQKSMEKYEVEGKEEEVEVYQGGKSFFKTYYNDHPKVNENKLISGSLVDNSAFANPNIQIGMPKAQFLEIFFTSSPVFEQVSQLDIYENELGEAYTSYLFEADSLSEIQFHSDYDWIKKEL